MITGIDQVTDSNVNIIPNPPPPTIDICGEKVVLNISVRVAAVLDRRGRITRQMGSRIKWAPRTYDNLIIQLGMW